MPQAAALVFAQQLKSWESRKEPLRNMCANSKRNLVWYCLNECQKVLLSHQLGAAITTGFPECSQTFALRLPN
jgi:hypothetical protein